MGGPSGGPRQREALHYAAFFSCGSETGLEPLQRCESRSRAMTVFRVNDQNDVNNVLNDDRLKDGMKLEVSGVNISAATVDELRKSQNLTFPFVLETPRIFYPEATLKIRLAD
jgi:hypothetical protein